MDKLFHGRLEWLTRDPLPRVAAIVILVMCALVVPLEIVPLAVAIPMGVTAGFGLALLVGDGLLMLFAFAAAAAAGYFAYSIIGGGGSGGQARTTRLARFTPPA